MLMRLTFLGPAGGMCDAGRIKYHLKYNLGRPECSIFITGFQAEGALCRRLVDRVKHVKIFGQDIPVRTHIYTIGGLSVHADQAGLMTWRGHFVAPADQTFVVHGESSNAAALAEVIQQQLHWQVSVPAQLTSVTF